MSKQRVSLHVTFDLMVLILDVILETSGCWLPGYLPLDLYGDGRKELLVAEWGNKKLRHQVENCEMHS